MPLTCTDNAIRAWRRERLAKMETQKKPRESEVHFAGTARGVEMSCVLYPTRRVVISVRSHVAGKRGKRYRIGEWDPDDPGTNAATYRRLARRLGVLLDEGRDPTQAIEAERALRRRVAELVDEGLSAEEAEKAALDEGAGKITVTQAVTAYLAEITAPAVDKRTGVALDRSRVKSHKRYARTLETRVVPLYGRLAVEQLDRARCVEIIRAAHTESQKAPQGRTGNGAAILTKSVLSGLLSFCANQGWIQGGNPLAGGLNLSIVERTARDVWLDWPEIGTLVRFLHQEIDAEDDEDAPRGQSRRSYAGAFALSLVTWQRKTTCMKAQWHELSDAARAGDETATADWWWNIPSGKLKGKNPPPHRVWVGHKLARRVLDAFRQTRQTEGKDKDEDWLFPGGSVAGHITGSERALQRFREAVGEKMWTLHDLRRTGSSLSRQLGVSMADIAVVLHHRDGHDAPEVTARHYVHGPSDLTVRTVLSRYLDALLLAVEGKASTTEEILAAGADGGDTSTELLNALAVLRKLAPEDVAKMLGGQH